MAEWEWQNNNSNGTLPLIEARPSVTTKRTKLLVVPFQSCPAKNNEIDVLILCWHSLFVHRLEHCNCWHTLWFVNATRTTDFKIEILQVCWFFFQNHQEEQCLVEFFDLVLDSVINSGNSAKKCRKVWEMWSLESNLDCYQIHHSDISSDYIAIFLARDLKKK